MMSNKIKFFTSLEQLIIQKSSYFLKLLYLIFQNFNVLHMHMLKVYYIVSKLQTGISKSDIFSISVVEFIGKDG